MMTKPTHIISQHLFLPAPGLLKTGPVYSKSYLVRGLDSPVPPCGTVGDWGIMGEDPIFSCLSSESTGLNGEFQTCDHTNIPGKIR